MTLAKKAQLSDLDGIHLTEDELNELFPDLSDSSDLKMMVELEPETDDELSLFTEEPTVSGEILIETPDGDEIHKEFDFTLPNVPGGDDQQDLAAEIEVETPDEEIIVESDPLKWTLKSFPAWLEKMIKKVPAWSGNDIGGCERALAYLVWLNKEISRALRSDIHGELDAKTINTARSQIYQGITRLQKRLDGLEAAQNPLKRKKKAEENQDMVKTAWKSGNFQVNVPVFLSYIAKVIINSHVSSGKDAEDVFTKLAEEYKLDKREKVSIIQILADMGYESIFNRNLYDGDFDPTNPENYDFMPNYQA